MSKKKCYRIDPRIANHLLDHLAKVRKAEGVSYFRIGDGERTVGVFVGLDAFNVMLKAVAVLNSPALSSKLVKTARAERSGKALTFEETFGK